MSTFLPVPHKTQLADGYCLPACVQMVLAYWGIERKQTYLAQQLGMIANAGTPASRIQLLASKILTVTYTNGELIDLVQALNQGIPPIILVYTKELPYWDIDTAHAVVLVGMEKNKAILNDPSYKQVTVSIGDLHLAWDEMANLYALLRRKD